MPFREPIEVRQHLDIYEKPVEEKSYVLVVDVSHGEEMDYSAFSVIDASQIPYKQVAKYRSNSIAPMLYPSIIHDVATQFNNAYVFIEINDIGQQVADILHYDLEYENLLMVVQKGRAGQMLAGGFGQGQAQLGIKTTKKVKQIGCLNLKNVIEDDKLIIEDFDTISELTSFISKGYSYEADTGYNDDLVMTLVLFAWLTTQPYFRDLTNLDLRRKMLEEKATLEMSNMLPFGFIDDGMYSEEDSFTDSSGTTWQTVEPYKDDFY
jgi:hypothetical protein